MDEWNIESIQPGNNFVNVKRLIIGTMLVILLEMFITAGYHSLAMAQKDSRPDQGSASIKKLPQELVGERASKLLAGINDNIKSGVRYQDEMKDASKEDRAVLQLQIYLLRKKVMADIHQLADALLELEEKGSQPKLRKEVEDIFTRVTPRLWYHIDRLREKIDTIRARRPEAKTEERPAIEHEVLRYTRRLDTFYGLSFAHIEKMELIGMDVKQVKQTFMQLLIDRAKELSGRLDLAITRIEDLEGQLQESPDDAAIAKDLLMPQKSLAANTASMTVVLDLMDEFDMDTKDHRARLVTMTQDISTGLMNTGVAISLVGQALKNSTAWLVENGPGVLLKLLILAGILLVFRFAARLVRAGLEKTLTTSNLNFSRLGRRMLISTVSNLVMILGILVALSQMGISLGPLLAGLGVAGFIVGFALQDTLGNFASGIMILLYRPYDVGDLVDVSGVFGKVHKMSLVSTSLLTLDNQLFVVPNNKIWGDVIKNVTAQDIRRVDMVFGISYGDDIPKAESILNDILTSYDEILDDPEPMVRVSALGESSVDFIVRPWVKVEDYWEVFWDVTKTVKMRFDEEGISIPFPQRDIHIHGLEGSGALTQTTVRAPSPDENPGNSSES